MAPKERAATVALEWHVGFRSTREQDPLDIRDGYAHTFLTIGHFQRCLRESGSKWVGEDFAAECLNTILPQLGLIEDTGTVWKPRKPDQALARRQKFAPDSASYGGADAQADPLRSYWWRVFRLCTFPKLIVSAYGVWCDRFARSRLSTACLVGLLRRQDLIPAKRRRSTPEPGSVQWAYQATGPP
jgi:hypothetical protein